MPSGRAVTGSDWDLSPGDYKFHGNLSTPFKIFHLKTKMSTMVVPEEKSGDPQTFTLSLSPFSLLRSSQITSSCVHPGGLHVPAQ